MPVFAVHSLLCRCIRLGTMKLMMMQFYYVKWVVGEAAPRNMHQQFNAIGMEQRSGYCRCGTCIYVLKIKIDEEYYGDCLCLFPN